MKSEVQENIVKTAEYVKQHGKEFEEKLLRESEVKFAFLNPVNEHHQYYLSLVEAGNTKERDNDTENDSLDVPEEPPMFVFAEYNKDNIIPAVDMEIIKKTAEFCVYSENEYETMVNDIVDLVQDKYGDEETFKFLHPDHKLNHLFIQFLNQYRQISHNKKRRIIPQHKFLEQCFKRAEYNEYVKQLASNTDFRIKSFKIRFAAFDWLNFINNSERIIKSDRWQISNNSDDNDTNYFKVPLNFNDLAHKKISTELTKKSLDGYFSVMEDNEAKEKKDAQTSSGTVTRKRKGKVIREAGETRLKRNKKK